MNFRGIRVCACILGEQWKCKNTHIKSPYIKLVVRWLIQSICWWYWLWFRFTRLLRQFRICLFIIGRAYQQVISLFARCSKFRFAQTLKRMKYGILMKCLCIEMANGLKSRINIDLHHNLRKKYSSKYFAYSGVSQSSVRVHELAKIFSVIRFSMKTSFSKKKQNQQETVP